MSLRVTIRSMFAALLLGIIVQYSNVLLAQVSLGSEFIVFVEGKNVLVPFFDGQTVADADDASNTVANFGHSDWAAPGFRWPDAVGADFSEMVKPTVAEGGAAMYLRLKVSSAYAGAHLCGTGTGDDCLSITLFDKYNGVNLADDREGRLKWFIPNELRDGVWHDLKIPLPPNNVSALDSAKVGKKVDGTPLDAPLDPNTAQWEYVGGWTTAVPGWGGTSGTPKGEKDPNWQAFQWDAVRGITVHVDFAGAGGPVQIDDLYFGTDATDISGTTVPPSAMSGASFATDGAKNRVSWAANPEFGGYRVYVDTEEITSQRIASGDLPILAEVPFNATSFEVLHDYLIPHPAMAPMDLHYAVTSINQFGIENTDVSGSSSVISNPNLLIQPYIYEINSAAADAIFGNLGGGVVSDTGFDPDAQSFGINSEHGKLALGGLPTSDDDLSGTFQIAFNRQYNELYVYGEVRDDVVARHPGTGVLPGVDAWGYDSVEMGWGTYDVVDAGGTVLGGSSHVTMQRGAAADYQFRFSWLGDNTTPDPSNTSTLVHTGTAPDIAEVTGGGSVFADLLDDQNNVVGYKFLSLMPFSGLVIGGTGDLPTTLPDVDGIKLMPLNIAINDGDDQVATNPRTRQFMWSIKPTTGENWYQNPSMWTTVAMAGIDVTGVANEDVADIPKEFELDQNYPNPFNPSTSIGFSLPAVDNVTLTVYNVLGQKVATLVQNETMSAGRHSIQFDARNLASGMYVYRIQVGNSITKTMPMILLK